jgi:esterase/lipase
MNKKSKKHIKSTILIIILLLGTLYILGKELDKKDEIETNNTFKRNSNGIIVGAESIRYQAQHEQAIIFIHGFSSTPSVFAELINDIKYKADSDIYAPLLPYNGRDLKTLSQTDNQVVLDYLEHLVSNFARIYKKITIVGLSYGGAQLTKLVADKKIPENATIIIYAPGFYITANNFLQRNFAKVYKTWRSYCDYKILGCDSPNYSSADTYAKPQFAEQKDFPYINIPALITMFEFDLKNRDLIQKINRPFNLIIAEDDSRVSYAKIKNACDINHKYCKLYSFSSGKHIIHWGKNKQKFEELLLKILYI